MPWNGKVSIQQNNMNKLKIFKFPSSIPEHIPSSQTSSGSYYHQRKHQQQQSRRRQQQQDRRNHRNRGSVNGAYVSNNNYNNNRRHMGQWDYESSGETKLIKIIEGHLTTDYV